MFEKVIPCTATYPITLITRYHEIVKDIESLIERLLRLAGKAKAS